jgi:hypothetical protein
MSIYWIFLLYILPLMIIAGCGIAFLVIRFRERNDQKHHPAE